MLISNTCSFQKKMLSNLPCVLIYSLTKGVLEDSFKFCVSYGKYLRENMMSALAPRSGIKCYKHLHVVCKRLQNPYHKVP